MKLYLYVIGVAMLLIAGFNIVFSVAAWYGIVISVVLCTAMQFALDGLIALIINKLPDRFFGVNNPLYNVSKTEMALYEKLGIHGWKDKVWELGGLGGFSKKSLLDPDSSGYIEKFIIECNKGVLTHRLSYPIGYLSFFLVPHAYAVSVAVPVATVNLFLNMLPTLILRYNTPRLKKLLRRMKRSESKAQAV